MRAAAVLGLFVLFVFGAVLGIAIGFVIFWVSLVRGARAVHGEGVVCRAELVARDTQMGPTLAGPALVRLSGAFGTHSDILGLEIRMQRTSSSDARSGDQDLLLATFESFRTAARDRAATNTSDYLANHYSTVTPWWVPGRGPTILRLTQPPAAPAERGDSRLARLDADLAADRARFELGVRGSTVELAELRLIERLPADARALRASMFRQGRALRPLGARNGIRATVYPLSQLARRLRGG